MQKIFGHPGTPDQNTLHPRQTSNPNTFMDQEAEVERATRMHNPTCLHPWLMRMKALHWKLVMQMGKERCVILKEPEHADALADFAKHFGLEYRGATLCAAVGAVMEKLLRPKRAAFSDRQRDEVYETQGHRCAICDAELRVGEDHGDHVDVL